MGLGLSIDRFADRCSAWSGARPSVAAGGLFVLVALSIVAPMFSARLGAIDDHDIVAIQRLLVDGGPVHAFLATDVGNGRFRPLYWVGYIAETAAWGQNVAGWYVDRLFLLLATFGAGYALARLWFRPTIATLVALLIVVGPQSEAWYRLGPQESLAVPLTLAGFALIGRDRAGLGLLLVTLAAFDKEPFALAAIMAAAWAWHRGARRSVVIAAGAIAIAALGIGAALLNHAGQGATALPGHLAPRYLLPWTAVAALCIGWLLTRYRLPSLPVAALVVVLTVGSVTAAVSWSAETRAFAAFIDELRATARPLIVEGNSEQAVAVKAYLPEQLGALPGCLIVNARARTYRPCP